MRLVLRCCWLTRGALSVRRSSLLARRTAKQPAQPIFRAGTDLVRVDVTVTQRGDEPVADLKIDDFEITEDGVPQTVETLKFIQVDGTRTVESRRAARDSLEGARAARSRARRRAAVCDLPRRLSHRQAAGDHAAAARRADQVRQPARPQRSGGVDGAADDALRPEVHAIEVRAAQSHPQLRRPLRRNVPGEERDRRSAALAAQLDGAAQRRHAVGAQGAGHADGRAARRPQVDPVLQPGARACGPAARTIT